MCDAPTNENEQNAFSVSGAYAIICSILKFYMYPPYNIGRAYRQKFIAQSMLPLMKEDAEVSLIPSEQHLVEAVILAFFPAVYEI